MAWFAKRLACEDFDLLLAYFRSTDLASHYYWRYFATDGAPPGVDRRPRPSACANGSFAPTRRSIARLPRSSRRRGRPANVIVLSDHGFRSARREIVRVAFDLDQALERLGYLVRDEHGGVDVERSRVYTFGSGHTQANKRVRFGASVGSATDSAARDEPSCAPRSRATSRA